MKIYEKDNELYLNTGNDEIKLPSDIVSEIGAYDTRKQNIEAGKKEIEANGSKFPEFYIDDDYAKVGEICNSDYQMYAFGEDVVSSAIEDVENEVGNRLKVFVHFDKDSFIGQWDDNDYVMLKGDVYLQDTVNGTKVDLGEEKFTYEYNTGNFEIESENTKSEFIKRDLGEEFWGAADFEPNFDIDKLMDSVFKDDRTIEQVYGPNFEDIILRDDASEGGGTAHFNETLGEFMYESDRDSQLKGSDSVGKLKDALFECGIAFPKEPGTFEKNEYLTNIPNDTIGLMQNWADSLKKDVVNALKDHDESMDTPIFSEDGSCQGLDICISELPHVWIDTKEEKICAYNASQLVTFSIDSQACKDINANIDAYDLTEEETQNTDFHTKSTLDLFKDAADIWVDDGNMILMEKDKDIPTKEEFHRFIDNLPTEEYMEIASEFKRDRDDFVDYVSSEQEKDGVKYIDNDEPTAEYYEAESELIDGFVSEHFDDFCDYVSDVYTTNEIKGSCLSDAMENAEIETDTHNDGLEKEKDDRDTDERS